MNNEHLQELARKARNQYHSIWQQKNREKVRQAQKRYWEKKAQELQNEERTEK